MSLLGRCKKAVTFLAENSGVITVNTQRSIEGRANPQWALEKIKEEQFDVNNGEDPREIITYITQPMRRQYVPILGTGNETLQAVNPATGELETVVGDKVGRGCSLPADTMSFGYDVRTSCLKARAVEIGPFCVLDLIRKNIHREVIQRLWSDTPPILKAQFARQLLREIVALGKFKFSAANGIPMSTDSPSFPAVPTGGPDIGMMRAIKRYVMPWGYADGSGAPTVNGNPSLQLYMGGDSVEWAVATRKEKMGYEINTSKTVDDGTFGETTVYEGIQMLGDDRPMRGILVPSGAGDYDFVEIEPTKVIAAEGEGFKEVPNENYEKDYVYVGGARYRVFEVAFWAHPKALVRESLGSLPSMPGGKTFNRKFDMSINPIPDYELADRGCNKDMFFFGYRILHAYAMKRRKYELAGAFLYIAPKPRYDVVDPWVDNETPAAAEAVTVRELAPAVANSCEPCDRDEAVATEPVMPTCSDLFPENGAGEIRLVSTAYTVEEGAGALTIAIERVGGNEGAASVVATITEGTATNPENFGTPSGFAGTGPWTKTISWADGVAGIKSFNIPIVAAAGDDSDKAFTVTLGTVAGATLDADRGAATVTLLDADEA